MARHRGRFPRVPRAQPSPDEADAARLPTPRSEGVQALPGFPSCSGHSERGGRFLALDEATRTFFPVSIWALGRSLGFWLIFCVSGDDKIKERV